jgi:hypothetical protein
VKKPIAYFYGILKEKSFQFYNQRLDEMREAGFIKDLPLRLLINGEILEWDWLHQSHCHV